MEKIKDELDDEQEVYVERIGEILNSEEVDRVAGGRNGYGYE